MGWKVMLRFEDGEEIPIGYENVSLYHQGNEILAMAGEDYADDEPEVYTYDEDEE